MRAVFAGARAVDVEPNWQERWRAYHRPVRVGPLWIGPPWESPPADAVAVVVDPGRAFGTGAHATTRLCLEVLLEVPRGSLVDVGCGSGVLAIAASKLGFAPVIALDVDPQAVDATQRNAAANDVELETRLGDAVADALPAADAIVANVTGEVVARLRVEAEWLVTSGYLASDQPTPPGYVAVERRGREGWAADLHRRQ
jgi:ribosomal protein L11 methyltransferase